MTSLTNITIYNKMFKKLIVLDLTIPSFGREYVVSCSDRNRRYFSNAVILMGFFFKAKIIQHL